MASPMGANPNILPFPETTVGNSPSSSPSGSPNGSPGRNPRRGDLNSRPIEVLDLPDITSEDMLILQRNVGESHRENIERYQEIVSKQETIIQRLMDALSDSTGAYKGLCREADRYKFWMIVASVVAVIAVAALIVCVCLLILL